MTREDIDEEVEQFEMEPIADAIPYFYLVMAMVFFGLAFGFWIAA